MSEPEKTSALETLSETFGAVSLSVLSDVGMIDLRGDLAAKDFRTAAERAIGCPLPDTPRTSCKKGNVTVLWLSIDQWLVVCPARQTGTINKKLSESLNNIPSLVVDLSDARTIIRLEGNGVREILMKGTPVDLTRADYSPGSVRRLRFAENAAMVHVRAASPDVIDLYVFRSYARYSWEWLAETASPESQLKLFCKQDPIAT